MIEIICPYCGSKGKKKKHQEIIEYEIAYKYALSDLLCGSCKKPFKSYQNRKEVVK